MVVGLVVAVVVVVRVLVFVALAVVTAVVIVPVLVVVPVARAAAAIVDCRETCQSRNPAAHEDHPDRQDDQPGGEAQDRIELLRRDQRRSQDRHEGQKHDAERVRHRHRQTQPERLPHRAPCPHQVRGHHRLPVPG